MTDTLRLTLTAAAASALSAAGLGRLFADGSPWARWALAGVAAVLAGTLAGRLLRLPAALVALLGAGALGVVTTALAAPAGLASMLPGPESLGRVADLLAAGQRDIAELTVPVPPTTGLLLVTTVGVGVVALAVDALAVPLRRPALAGVPLLALLVVPAGLAPGGVGVVAFVLAACGWLALLLTDGQGRAARWGRVVSGAPAGPLAVRGQRRVPDPRGHAGRRIGVAALGLSLVVPLLVPGSLQGRLDVGGGWGGFGGVGSASVDTYNPIVRLKGELTRPEARTVLRVRTTDPDYLRLTALDLYDGATWSQSPLTAPRAQRVEAGVPLPPGLSPSSTRTATATVEVVDLSARWLPVHYPPREVEVRGDWRYDAPSRTVFSSRDETSGLPPYTITSSRPTVEPDDLDGQLRGEDSLQDYLALPPLPAEVVTLAQQLTEPAENAYEQAVALQEFFRETGDFVYDEQVPEGNSGNDLLDFLVNRRGYCEQFAAAMAVMARAVGLPARVAIGYTAGTEVEPGLWEVSSHDAHAWPEVNLPGAGWIRFEPTPRDDGASPAPPYTIPPVPVEPAPAPELPAPAPGGPSAAPQVPQGGVTDGGLPQVADAESGQGALVAVGVLAALAVAATPALVHVARLRRAWTAPPGRERAGRAPGGRGRARRGSGRDDPAGAEAPVGRVVGDVTAAALARHRAELAWQQVREQAADLGLPVRDSDGPRAAAARLTRDGGLIGSDAAALERLAAAVELARYSRRAPQEESLRRDAAAVRAGLRAGASRSVRLRALLLPRSTLLAGAHAVGRLVADALDVLDATGTRAWQSLTRRAGRLAGG